MDGIVTEIMRFSLKDGPGIRTTVFLKGCNMACKWCHNPETISMQPQLMHYPDRCIGCGACMEVCPRGALATSASLAAGATSASVVLDRAKCIACGACADHCYAGALVISGMRMSVVDIMSEVMQDIDYYRNSGGGLTIGGGEPACQPEFLRELLKEAKAAGIHTAIETNMHADWETYESILPYLDLVMLDIKHSDDAEHARWTGAGNAKLLENIRKITSIKPTFIRVPVIPGVNDSSAEIAKIASVAKGLNNIERIELLLYNPLGESKYEALGIKDYRFRGTKPTPSEHAEELKKTAKTASGNITVKIG